MPVRCSVPRAFDDDLPCHRTATHRVVSACVHEHLSVDDVCEPCLQQLRSGGMVCTVCAAAEQVSPSTPVQVESLPVRAAAAVPGCGSDA